MANDDGGDRPQYRVYRSRKGLLARLRGQSDPREQMRQLRKRPKQEPDEPEERPGRARPPWRRALKLGIYAVLGWIGISIVAFFVSAQLQEGVSDKAAEALSTGGSLVTGSTVLVLGSDARPPGSKEPGAGGPGRSDSIMLLHVGVGSVRRLSILRDSFAEIPGHGAQKINAAYALGGPALTIETVENFLGNGLEINHMLEIDFENFPDFIDSLGGIDVTLDNCVRSPAFGGAPFYLGKGEHHLSGRKALRFARVRKNECAPNEDDRARARRQQQVMSAIRSRMFSPWTFVRLPWVAWAAPRTLRTDMKGPGLSLLFLDLLTGGAGKTRVLKPSGAGPGGSLTVSEDEKAKAVRQLVDG